MSRLNHHPMQQIVRDEDGRHRFRENAIVRYLLDAGPFDMNHLALLPVSREDRMQFAQLIGYSVSGYGDLGYVSRESLAAADARSDELHHDHHKVKQAPRANPK